MRTISHPRVCSQALASLAGGGGSSLRAPFGDSNGQPTLAGSISEQVCNKIHSAVAANNVLRTKQHDVPYNMIICKLSSAPAESASKQAVILISKSQLEIN